MKLYEIEGFDKGAKVKRKKWTKTKYVIYAKGCFINSSKKEKIISIKDIIEKNDWLVYEEPKKFKRYWLWNIKTQNNIWYRYYIFLNDELVDTSGVTHFPTEVSRKKIKNQYIDIEV